MKQILIATHGKMASGIRYTAELIVGELAKITTIDAYVTPEDTWRNSLKNISARTGKTGSLFYGLDGMQRQSKTAKYAQQENVTLITGTNLRS